MAKTAQRRSQRFREFFLCAWVRGFTTRADLQQNPRDASSEELAWELACVVVASVGADSRSLPSSASSRRLLSASWFRCIKTQQKLLTKDWWARIAWAPVAKFGQAGTIVVSAESTAVASRGRWVSTGVYLSRISEDSQILAPAAVGIPTSVVGILVGS